jgi:hypothetical protein
MSIIKGKRFKLLTLAWDNLFAVRSAFPRQCNVVLRGQAQCSAAHIKLLLTSSSLFRPSCS